MPATGYIQVHAYESYAQIPLKDVAISVTASDGTALAMRLTDRSGKIVPIEIPTPELAESQSPGSPDVPFTAVTLHARKHGYEQIQANEIQIFAPPGHLAVPAREERPAPRRHLRRSGHQQVRPFLLDEDQRV